MTDTKKLLAYIEKSGLKKSYIAKALGINSYTLSQKINNESDFKVPEMRKLCELLHIPEEERGPIFFND